MIQLQVVVMHCRAIKGDSGYMYTGCFLCAFGVSGFDVDICWYKR